ncbi:MAG: non-heme iron oxygenase ferredoxin subunit [Burkholderiales bacterium]|jgi:3-phenylpropionate/trans-cinnamate dioxygenase ferredoxin subunit
MNWIDVAGADEIESGGWRTVDVDGRLVAVFSLDDGYYAIEDVCTHDGGELTGGEIDGDCIACPRHGARFNIKTGAVLSPPAYEDVLTFPVRVESGRVQVADEPT